MQQFTEAIEARDNYMTYIYTPFCGTCQLARGMLDKIESVHQQDVFYEMNAALNPQFMQTYQIESVPCLLIKQDGEIKEKVYAFKSIGNIYHYLLAYQSDLFGNEQS